MLIKICISQLYSMNLIENKGYMTKKHYKKGAFDLTGLRITVSSNTKEFLLSPLNSE